MIGELNSNEPIKSTLRAGATLPKKLRLQVYTLVNFVNSLNNMKSRMDIKIQHGNKQCQALGKSRNYAIIITIIRIS